jgi:hypothetical protein
MASRIEVELTSKRDDDTWTWRAAGAKQPKGIVSSSLLYEGAKVGDIVKADASFDIDGIVIQAIIPPKAKEGIEGLIEIKGKAEPTSLVTSTLVKRRDNRRSGGRERGDRTARPPRRESESSGRPPRDRAAQGERREHGERPRRAASPEAAKPRPKKLLPLNKHRNAFLANVTAEQRPIAEQLIRGGIPQVRTALATANEQARTNGTPETPESAVMAIAEQLVAASKAAVWMDRAEAALKDADEISLRDLRSVVASSDSAGKDATAQELRDALRAKLAERVERSIAEWISEITKALDENRIIRALRLSARPTEPTAKFPEELSARLVEATNAAMVPETTEDRWNTLIEAVAESPIRRQVRPGGLPEGASAQLIEFAKESSGRIPALAEMLGVTIPPPPKPRLVVAPDGRAQRRRRERSTEERTKTTANDAPSREANASAPEATKAPEAPASPVTEPERAADVETAPANEQSAAAEATTTPAEEPSQATEVVEETTAEETDNAPETPSE